MWRGHCQADRRSGPSDDGDPRHAIGEVKVNGRKWKAGQAAPMMPLAKGTKVRVVASKGMILLVGPTKTGPGGRVRLG